MITSDSKNRIDELWTLFRTCGITNPLTVIEQISFLIYSRLLDLNESCAENRRKRTDKSYVRRFNDDEQHLRWSQFRHLEAEEMLQVVRDEVFPDLKTKIGKQAAFAGIMKDAELMIQQPDILAATVNTVDQLPLMAGDARGDLYEYLIEKLTVAGSNRQFRSPRHIIRLMVEMIEPKPTESIGDPACGTGGFLVMAMKYMLEQFTSPEAVFEESEPDSGGVNRLYKGDLLEQHRDHIDRQMFHGFELDVTMLRIAVMNLMLHGVDHPQIHCQNALSANLANRFPLQMREMFDVVFSNPPFGVRLDLENVDSNLLHQIHTRKAELLFPLLILRMLKDGGRSAVIVPSSVLSGISKDCRQLRKLIVDHHQLEAVISLPEGIFRPYAGIRTGILVFTKGRQTGNVFFYDAQADGYSPDDRKQRIEDNDLPDCLARWRSRHLCMDAARTEKGFSVSADEIRRASYDLSVVRYAEAVYTQKDYNPPKVLLEQMKSLNRTIDIGLAELKEMIN